MGDHQAGASAQELCQGAADQRLGGRVDARRRFVQNHQARFAQQDARNRHELALAGGQLPAAGADERRDAVSQTPQPGAGPETLEGTRHRRCRHRVVEQGDIVAQAARHDLGLLRQHGDSLPQVPAAELAHRHSAEAYAPFLQLDHSGQQAGDGRLAAAGTAHQSQHRPRGQLEVGIPQHRGTVDVGKADAVELDRAGPRRQASGAVECGVGLRQQFVDADEGSLCLLELLHLRAQRGQRPPDQLAVAVDQPHGAEGQQPGPMQPGRHAQPHRHPADEQQRVDQGQRVTGDLGGDLARQPPCQNPLEAGTNIALSAQRPQLFHGREPFAEPPEECGACRPAAHEARHAEGADAVHDHRAHHRERRHRDTDAPILEQQHDHDAARHQQVGGQLHQQVRQQATQLRDVAVDALQQGAGSGTCEERMPEIDGMAKQRVPQVVHRLPGQHGTGVRAHDLQPRPDKGDPDEQRGHPHQPLDGGTVLRQVKERPYHQRAGHLQARPGHQRGDHHRQHAAPPSRVGANKCYITGKAGAGGPSHAATNGVRPFTGSTSATKALMQLPQCYLARYSALCGIPASSSASRCAAWSLLSPLLPPPAMNCQTLASARRNAAYWICVAIWR